MKKLAIVTGAFFLVLSLGIYLTKNYKYREYVLKTKSNTVRTYVVNINLGDWRAFDNLPGIGPKLAQAIVEDRESKGRFNSIEEIKRVKGIGEKKFADIKQYLTLEVY